MKKNISHITIVGFGASTVEGKHIPDTSKRWLNRLLFMLEKEFPGICFNVINSGVGGNSAREAMQRFERDVLRHNPNFVLVLFGGNNNDPENHARRVSENEFYAHLEEIRRGLKDKAGIIVITFPPVIDEQHAYSEHAYFKDSGGQEAMVERYRYLTKQFASTHGYPLVDFHSELKKRMIHAPANFYTRDDGVHLTEAGNKVLADMLFEILHSLVIKLAGLNSSSF